MPFLYRSDILHRVRQGGSLTRLKSGAGRRPRNMKYGLRIENVKQAKHYEDETEAETGEPANLEEKFEFLLDVLTEKETQLDDLEEKVEDFVKRWLNHRHGIGQGVYSGKGER